MSLGTSAAGDCRVLVFCGSSESCAPKYRDAAARLGKALAEASMSVVYGGGRLGSMGAVALPGGSGALEEHFLSERHAEMWAVVEEPEQVPEAIRTAPDWPEGSLAFASV